MSTRKRLHLFFRPKNALPQFYLHADGRFLLTQMAAVAELEAGLISERTKAALNIARERIATTGQRNHPDVKRTRQSQRGSRSQRQAGWQQGSGGHHQGSRPGARAEPESHRRRRA